MKPRKHPALRLTWPCGAVIGRLTKNMQNLNSKSFKKDYCHGGNFQKKNLQAKQKIITKIIIFLNYMYMKAHV